MTEPGRWVAPLVERPEDSDDTGDERRVLTDYLAYHRATLLWKVGGLDATQLSRRAVPPSTLSLLGLVRHLAKVERIWFRIRLDGQDVEPLFPGDDEDFDEADPATAERDYERLLEEQRLADDAIAAHSLDDVFEHRTGPISLRVLLQHVMHEYARHNGHADLLREQVDGATGY